MVLKRILYDPRMGLLAIIGPAIALTSIAICIMLSPWFIWTDNAISDFGVSEVALLFNASLVVCGTLVTLFTISVFLGPDGRLLKVGIFIMMLASISLVGIGIFNESMRPWHYVFSVLFFVLLIISCLLLGFSFLNSGNRVLGILGIMVALVGIFAWAYEATIDWGSGVAIPEALTFVPGGLWFMLLGYWQFFSKPVN